MCELCVVNGDKTMVLLEGFRVKIDQNGQETSFRRLSKVTTVLRHNVVLPPSSHFTLLTVEKSVNDQF